MAFYGTVASVRPQPVTQAMAAYLATQRHDCLVRTTHHQRGTQQRRTHSQQLLLGLQRQKPLQVQVQAGSLNVLFISTDSYYCSSVEQTTDNSYYCCY